MIKLQCCSKLLEIEQILTKNQYFSKNVLPGFADAVIFKLLAENKKYPDKKLHPHFYHWYVIMKQFSHRSLQEWISQKLYIQNQSQRALMLISQIFLKDTNFLSKIKGRKPIREISITNNKKSLESKEKQKLTPVDINSPQYFYRKAQYLMIIQLRIVQSIEQLMNKFYQLKQNNLDLKSLKIKQLKFNRKQKAVYLKFLIQKHKIDLVKDEIQKWSEVRHIIFKITKQNLNNPQNQSSIKPVAIR